MKTNPCSKKKLKQLAKKAKLKDKDIEKILKEVCKWQKEKFNN